MKISDLYKQKKPVFSLEVFPPKRKSNIESLYKAVEALSSMHPDFISVTYGAGGSAADTKTADIARIIKEQYGMESAVHLTCLYNSKEDIDLIVEQLKQRNIRNILALRGDYNPFAFGEHHNYSLLSIHYSFSFMLPVSSRPGKPCCRSAS